MTGTQLKELNTEIRGGREMDDTIFYTLLNLAKSTFERMRPWRKLTKKDSSKSSTSATTYLTSFALPTGFIMTLPRRTLKLVDVTNLASCLELQEVPWERWDEYKTTPGYFSIDHLNSVYYVSTVVSRTFTHHFFFISTTDTLTANNSWAFPEEFHPALAFEVAAMDELGMDYDEINARQGNANIARSELIMQLATKWDDTLVRSALGI